ncbi:hypothetical protein JKY72_03930 [Candidatus Gracilibacteria bacterium]|nr:hypothetical protein [Candidatus Gracilibacteria bacterium]
MNSLYIAGPGSDRSREDQTCVYGGEKIPAGRRYSLSVVGATCFDHAHDTSMLIQEAVLYVKAFRRFDSAENITPIVRKRVLAVLPMKG